MSRCPSNINRVKNNVVQQIGIFQHRYSWLLCAHHALATQLAVGCSKSDALFPHVRQTNIAAYVNGILKNLAEKDSELREYTSHAVKRTAATDAIGHPQINASWVVLRAGWKADAISTFFSYLTLTPESDSYVGKALAGWNSLDRGGASPTINSLSPDQRESFTEYAVHLLSLGGEINREVKVNLAGVLVLWYRDVKHMYPTCSLIKKMESFPNIATDGVLTSWSTSIEEWWLLQNRIIRDGYRWASRRVYVRGSN